tara:strand:+ start:357 stop:503 length:147 start_codon:yes stop_codon:yes gene_type:complete
MTKNQEILEKIKVEMENIRELYVKGYLTKNTYQKETRKLFELATKFGV